MQEEADSILDGCGWFIIGLLVVAGIIIFLWLFVYG